jgi:RNA polymerase sigma-70 factor (ECF subfamily)
MDMLRSRKTRREEPMSVHMPDPIVDPAAGTSPEHEAPLADSVGPALLVVLETLSPPERIAFVLHDIFAVPFDRIHRRGARRRLRSVAGDPRRGRRPPR